MVVRERRPKHGLAMIVPPSQHANDNGGRSFVNVSELARSEVLLLIWGLLHFCCSVYLFVWGEPICDGKCCQVLKSVPLLYAVSRLWQVWKNRGFGDPGCW